VFREVRRVLSDDGTCWINIGDSYANVGKWGGSSGGKHAEGLHGATSVGRGKRDYGDGLKNKDLIGIPWMLAFALRADGWYLRQDIIWHKPNPMPESVTDRCTKAHEYVFLLSKSAKYLYDAEAVREESVKPWNSSKGFSEKGQSARSAGIDGHRNGA
jgi:DNA modification methylase